MVGTLDDKSRCGPFPTPSPGPKVKGRKETGVGGGGCGEQRGGAELEGDGCKSPSCLHGDPGEAWERRWVGGD